MRVPKGNGEVASSASQELVRPLILDARIEGKSETGNLRLRGQAGSSIEVHLPSREAEHGVDGVFRKMAKVLLICSLSGVLLHGCVRHSLRLQL